MRPLPGDDVPGRPRSSDDDGPSTFRLPSAPQMTYFLGDESAIGSSSQPPPVAHHRPKEQRTVPVAETAELPKPRAQPPHADLEKDKEPAGCPPSSKGPPDGPRNHEDNLLSRPISPVPRSTDMPNLSRPLTPVLLGASGPASALSSVSSRRNSLCLSEDLGSCPPSMKDADVAVEDDDGGEDEPAEDPGASCSSMMDSGSAPQLIMPSIKMPSRRPFTDEGKRMGRLKVLIAGDSGVGKTSLIKAIVQSCEHIVHVDPITPSASSLTRSLPTTIGAASAGRPKGSRRQPSKESSGTSQITEIYASTKPYPEWWSEVDDFRILRRRKSLGDAVLDRNLCFVDTPGYGSGSSAMDTITPVAQYIEAHLQRISSNVLSDGDLLNLLGGEGGVLVDAVFYLVSNRLRPVDVEYLRQLSPLTNIIILLAQTDLMSSEQVAASKNQILSQLKEADIRLFSFSIPSSNSPATSDSDKPGIYAISSATGSDHDTMDASLLMSPDYVQPLIPSELATLVEQVFSSNGVSWLRHSVARKYVQWRKSALSSSSSSADGLASAQPPSLSRSQTLAFNLLPSSAPLSPSQHPTSSPAPSSSSANQVLTGPMGATSRYALARLADHTQREERLAQVRLANWAADLQKSLAREREQYAALARGERAVWLAERISECVREGSLVPVELQPAAQGQGQGQARSRSRSEAAAERGSSSSPPAGDVHGQGADGQRGKRHHTRGRGASSRRRDGQHQYHRHQQQQQQQYSQQQRQQRSRQDPLGLLEVADDLRHKSLIALEVLGSLGVLGGLALWVTRHYLHLQAGGWVVGEWERFWYGAAR
ncbi:30de8b82-2b4c-4040-ad6f-c99934bba539 [Thermothielavioides terrestris]|uniref:30de8b82-2b4c-4040-ad6f-c99934bba539 n=1 Tax=Thermothielavioides terrestris TaxID=2587410 RepID=A0A3S4ATY9_9PEZI|nr:30de8b82-2b4c-4040-ad6f-c99934bba539 [Thermothielavioides terrestris]